MFREMRRKKQQISNEECIKILKEEKRGVLSVLGDDDYPYGLPINHYYNEDNHCIYFHCAKVGHKIDAMKKHPKVSLCVYDKGYKKEGEWSLNVNSVIVFGQITFVEDENEKVDVLRKLAYKFVNDDKYIEDEINKFTKVVQICKINIDHMTGKLVNES